MGAKDAKKPEVRGHTLTEIRSLARILSQYDLTELEVEVDGSRVMLKRQTNSVTVEQRSAPTVEPAPIVEQSPATNGGGLKSVISPFVGTFYRAPSPDAQPFVELGDSVRQGQTLCIVEAMKLMNEIEAELDGKIVEVLVSNAEPVEYGQALFRVQPM